MIKRPEHQIAEIGVRLLDDAYMAWRAAETEAASALRAWLDGRARKRDDVWFAYQAALDREEAAARDLERLARLAAPCLEELTASADWGID